jgi:hypothetical protein
MDTTIEILYVLLKTLAQTAFQIYYNVKKNTLNIIN